MLSLRVIVLVVFIKFHFSFLYLGALWTKQLFHSRMLDFYIWYICVISDTPRLDTELKAELVRFVATPDFWSALVPSPCNDKS